MTILNLDAKLTFPSHHIPPDSFNILNDSLPSDDFVVSRSPTGAIISLYGDIVWDFTIYHPDGKPSPLLFSYWDQGELTPNRQELIKEIKHIFFILIWLRDKSPLSFGTLRNYLTITRDIAKFAERKHTTLKEVIGNNKLFLEFVRSQNSGWFIETLSSLLLLLIASSYQNLAIKIIEPEIIRQLQKQNKQYRASLNQHAPIPTRIYSEILKNWTCYLEEWEKVSNELMLLILECYEYKLSCSAKRAYFHSILDNVSEPLKNFVNEHTGQFTIKQISSLVTATQCICKLVIQAFSGMRDEEAQTIPYQCIKEVISNSQKHYLIIGRTTKLNQGNAKTTQWITSIEGLKAVRIAQKIADHIYQILDEQGIQKSTDIFQYPLFISASYFGFSSKPIESTIKQYRIGTLYSKQVVDKLIPQIKLADVEELEQIDPHRAWRSEEIFLIGQYWPFTTHQLRRSLALYAQRSGLVSLPSLRRQLQHITNEMTSYYAKGSTFAKNLINDDKSHFANEWQQTQLESNSLGYIFNVLMSNTPLYGGHIHWMENTLKNEEGMIIFDRKQTLQRFKKGDISYKETIMGGCTKVGACNFTATNWLQINCLKDNCRHLIVSLPKLEKVITAQEKMINFLDITSLEYRTEVSHLQILKETKHKIIELKGAE